MILRKMFPDPFSKNVFAELSKQLLNFVRKSFVFDDT